ncbi:type II toxin-antitoxin system RelE family toxin [Lancefieldella rimae]|uniref:type II toxin-antitoxin system RelE family toxin n=1 Tax=Lancefieldella rimae TaxID=1383 RepID=UPI0009F6D3DF|nr:type II toxin-antitoxin system RelE/ParE family toxin [Lancefieldella rimae]MBF4804705.1 type II toxin-antitoxin system RelE/ParE family toxin [Lancefieldella rimae]
MSFHVEYTRKALSQLKKMDRFTARLILSWIENNLGGCIDPCRLGKGLTADRSGEWRYRVGNYKILCLIQNDTLIIEVFSIGHHKDIYRRHR